MVDFIDEHRGEYGNDVVAPPGPWFSPHLSDPRGVACAS